MPNRKLTPTKDSPCMNALTANIIGCAAAAAPVLRQRKHFKISDPKSTKQLYLAISAMISFAIISVCHKDGPQVYISFALTVVCVASAIAPTRVTDEMAVRIELGPSSFLEDCRAGYKALQQVSVYPLGEYTSMFLKAVSANTVKESLASFGLRPLAYGNVKMSHLGGVSKPVIIADSKLETHIIIGIEHSTVSNLRDAVLASKNQAQQGQEDKASWISYSFVDTTRDDKNRGSVDFQMDGIYFNTWGELESLDFEVRPEDGKLV